MILEMCFPIFAVPIRINNWTVWIKEIPAMSPGSNCQGDFCSEKIEMRIIRNLLNDCRWSEKETRGTKCARNWFRRSIFCGNRPARHRESSIPAKLLCTHRKYVTGIELIRGSITRRVTRDNGLWRARLPRHVDQFLIPIRLETHVAIDLQRVLFSLP